MGLTELKGILNKFKDIENKQDKIYPKCKNSKAKEIDSKIVYKDSLDFAYNYSILDEARRGECPSYNIHSNARSLAKLAAFMANNGSLDEKVLMSQETWDKMHLEPTLEANFGFDYRFQFS